MRDRPFVPYIAERDIDLLLIEELHASPAFTSWFLSRTLGSAPARFLGAWHSVGHPTLGESDLVVLAETDRATAAVLVENKVAAIPQPAQADRYRLRGEAGVRDGLWGSFRTYMTAPQAYLDRTADAVGYDGRLSYEAIRGWFEQAAATDARAAYKAGLIGAAIDQHRRGFTSVPDPVVTRFWEGYWQIASAEYPRLGMKRPGPTAAGCDWPEFRPAQLRGARRILHKLAAGAVDLEIAASPPVVKEMLARSGGGGDGLEVAKTGKSASVRVWVPVVDRFAEAAAQAERIRAGLAAAIWLLDLSGRLQAGEQPVETDPQPSS